MLESQIVVIGIVASLLTWIIKILASQKVKLSRVVVNIVLYVISVLFATLWADVALPSLPQWGGDIVAFVGSIWAYINAWVALGAPILGTATLIYNLLYEKVIVPATTKLLHKKS